ncbi:AAA family ATPase [Sphingomonas sp. So64.6b]|uniref:AAA family ATPase n=1 Tax=Sphingomonas sp. So64.6b TaxID=2997354 RepID=UPI0016015D72|nr:AAA family ATPase [Sphingomonas sp. So64.6b]QNA86439.1 AAA family ATPase [Sphingomonas sp. So64.6b]
MRLRSVWISQYKNLRDFSISFDGDGFIDIFVGKNGSGKSNFLEALIEIFDHIFDFDPDAAGPGFDYAISFEIAGTETRIKWRNSALIINDDAGRRTLGTTPLPDHILVYYSGHNPNVGKLIDRYEDKFEGRIDGPGFSDSPKIVPVTGEIKDLLLAMMLLLPDNHVGRAALMQRLGVKIVKPDIRITLQRPRYAQGRNAAQFNVDDVQGDKYWKPRSATKDFLDRLDTCLSPSPKRGPIRTEGYQEQADAYFLFLNLERLRAEFSGDGICSLFRQFYSLKVLGMLDTISVEVELESGFTGGTAGFSDGQFQMVYMLATAELFKDRNIISLFDEPDAFLHPEWQFDFLRQVNAISDQAARTNHILLNTHSASTIVADAPCRIRNFCYGDNGLQAIAAEKSDLVRSLSAGLITFSESEVSLSIEHILVNTDGPVLFAEGVSDALILTTAWERLFPGLKRNFAIESAFGSGYLRKMLQEQDFFALHSARKVFGIFDFDTAFNEWKNIGKQIEFDPSKCLVRKRVDGEWYAMLLPVDPNIGIRSQILRPRTNDNFAHKSKLDIELMFFDAFGVGDHFEVDQSEPYECFRFIGSKSRFAKETVPQIATIHFEPFRPIFDFIRAKAPMA